MLRFVFTLFVLSCLAACTVPQYTAKTLPEEQLHFGERDPFSGQLEAYVLLENGQLFKRTFREEKERLQELLPFPPEEGRKLYREMKDLDLEQYDFDRPDGMSPFIRVLTPDIDHSIIWGDERFTVREEVESFYQKLMNLVQDRPLLKQKVPKTRDDPYW